ncbi:MAG: hypothetical protein QRY74_02380 [Chlamydia sp.]
MPFIRSNSVETPIIELIKKLVLFFTFGYTLLFSLFQIGFTSYNPSSLFRWSHTSFIEYLVKTWALSFTMPYSEFSWDILWDLALLNLFYAPVVSFILSYLGTKSFFYMWFLYAYIAGGSMMIFSRIFAEGAPPSSIFLSIAYGTIVFWVLMMRTSGSKPNAFFVISISLEWIIGLCTLLCVIIPITQGKIAIGLSSFFVGVFSYLYGVVQWRMSSNVEQAISFEEKIRELYYEAEKLIQWHILRYIRRFFSK